MISTHFRLTPFRLTPIRLIQMKFRKKRNILAFVFLPLWLAATTVSAATVGATTAMTEAETSQMQTPELKTPELKTSYLKTSRAPAKSKASSKLIGDFQLEEWLLETRLSVEGEDPYLVDFDVKRSYLKWSWQHQSIGAILLLGHGDLINRPFWYSPKDVEPGLHFAEAYVMGTSSFGDWALGLQPILFGYEGSLSEAQNYFEPSLLYQESWLPRRDRGLSYMVSKEGFGVYLAVHNGESTNNEDNKLWVTGRWDYSTDNLSLGLSGLVAEVGGKESTQSQAPEGVGFIRGKTGKVRMINGFLRFYDQKNFAVLESTYGEILQDKNRTEMFTLAHFDVSYRFAPDTAVLLQGDYRDPNTRRPSDSLYLIRLGVMFFDAYEGSRLSFTGTHSIEEVGKDKDKEKENKFWVSWQISPKFFR